MTLGVNIIKLFYITDAGEKLVYKNIIIDLKFDRKNTLAYFMIVSMTIKSFK
jgi:hypothetical protein